MNNQAAWITASKARPLKVDTAPKVHPGPNEVLIKNHAVAVNPVDWKIQVWMLLGSSLDVSALPLT